MAELSIRFAVTTVLLLLPRLAFSQPTANSGFNREQKTTVDFDVDDLLRIWVVYVGQGDGILIQLPPKYNYDPNPSDGDSERSERVDVLVDGGPGGMLKEFVEKLYENSSPSLEHVVITHHDSDHIKGVTSLLKSPPIPIGTIYHNGLGTYNVNKPDFAPDTKGSEAVIKRKNKTFHQGMAFLEPGSKMLQSKYILNDRTDLVKEFDAKHLKGVYDDFAEKVKSQSKVDFSRAKVGNPFVEPKIQADSGPKVSFELLWPLDKVQKYGDWGKTINGNSVAFRLVYGDFAMLFTGDLNKQSEPKILNHYAGNLDALDCDVIKVPHHGSHHNHKQFFKRPGFSPVLGVASMGSKGFRKGWKHPSTEVISWLGGFDRVYHTFIHEGAFDWDSFNDTVRQQMIELTHLVIETNGNWFRLVEVDAVTGNIHSIPTVTNTQHADGTLWIRTK